MNIATKPGGTPPAKPGRFKDRFENPLKAFVRDTHDREFLPAALEILGGTLAAVMIAVVAVAALAALWRPVRHGALLLTGATVGLVAQAISALIQVSEPATAAQFGISQAQASAAGLSITSGVTPIFWVYCVFVISLVVSCAWMLTSPAHPAMSAAPQSPGPATMPPSQDRKSVV